ncbi:MAG: S-layer family protein [Synechococcales bacterium]|nr:S-layer family protein [Synechococcales bacterium]
MFQPLVTLSLTGMVLMGGSAPAIAQIIPDATLPNPSIVPPNCTDCVITGGTARGANLFHSFEQFSVPRNGRAYFDQSGAIAHIISRITGNGVSTIDGLIQANGTANLFLINPNGIVFQENARLDIGGSFLATTAAALEFADSFQFSATNPGASPLLTVSVPIGLQFGANPGALQLTGAQLQGGSGATVALVGGDVTLRGGIVTAPLGRIEVGGVADNGRVALDIGGAQLRLAYDALPAFRDVQFLEGSILGAGGITGGDIQIQGRRIGLRDSSFIQSIAATGPAGAVVLRASEQIELVGETTEPLTGIFNEVQGDATGENAGILLVETPRLVLRDGAQISTTTEGTGRGVDLIVRSADVELVGALSQTPSGLFARACNQNCAGVTGDGGRLVVESDRLLLQDGAQISTATLGAGRAGSIDIQAAESIQVIGRWPQDLLIASGIFAQVEEGATGDGGTLTLTTPRLVILDGAQVSTAARSEGRGGDLVINAPRLVRLSGTAPIDRDDNISGILVSAERGARNDAGTLTLTTDRLVVEDGARISADNFGAGQGGSVRLEVERLQVRRNGQIRAASFDEGPTAGGAAGSLTVTARQVDLAAGGEVTVSSEAIAQAGQLTFQADSLQMDNAVLTAETDAGQGANVRLQIADQVRLTNGSEISAATRSGQAGQLRLTVANGDLLLAGEGSQISVEATAGGIAGDLQIDAERLVVLDGAQVTVSSPQGQAGNLLIRANTIALQQGQLTAETGTTPADGSGANIEMSGVALLAMGDRSLISAQAFAEANGGNVTIDNASGFIAAIPDQDSDIIANAVEGQGGAIQITTQGLFGLEERRAIPNNGTNDIDASSQFGLAGTVTITRLEIDPSRGLVALPTNLIDAARLIAQNCSTGGIAAEEQGEFVVTGRGGLPPAPDSAQAFAPWDDLRRIEMAAARPDPVGNSPSGHRFSNSVSESAGDRPSPFVEAQGWQRDSQGQIQLVAQAAPVPNAVGLGGDRCRSR